MPQVGPFPTLRTEIAGLPVAALAERFGTPVFVYDAAKIAERIGDLRAFDVIRYAQKACSNLAILDLVRRQGVLVDAVSAGEIRRALAAGYHRTGNPPPIVYTADIFDRDVAGTGRRPRTSTSTRLARHDRPTGPAWPPAATSRCGSIPASATATARRPTPAASSRSTASGTSSSTTACGGPDRHGLAVTGLHMHIGSGTDLEHLSQVCGAMEQAALAVGRTRHLRSAPAAVCPCRTTREQSYVDLDEYFRLWDAARRRLEQAFGHPVSLEIEPGRYLVAESGYLIAEIRAVKRQGGNLFYLLDAGFNNLARPILYGVVSSDVDRRRPTAGPNRAAAST